MKNTRTFTLTALFLAMMILLAVTPLGFIPIGPLNATTMHLPVIIASIILGPRIGAFMGGTFGLISLIRSTMIPTPLSFVFSPFIPVIGTDHGSWKALIVVFIPRILIGIIPYFVFKGLSRRTDKGRPAQLFVAGLIGSLVNTILVMNLIYFLFQQEYAQVVGRGIGVLYGAILGTILTSGIPEALIAGFVTSAICMILLKLTRSHSVQ